jgi:hypothetical protein
LREQLLLRRPSVLFLLYSPAVTVRNLPGTFRADVFGNDTRHQIRVLAREDLYDATARGVAPQHDIAKAELLDDTLEVTDMILDEVAAFRVPAGVAVSTHVHGQHVVPAAEMRGHMIEGARHAVEPMDQQEWLLVRVAPVHVVDTKTADVEEMISGHRRSRLTPCVSRRSGDTESDEHEKGRKGLGHELPDRLRWPVVRRVLCALLRIESS